MRARNSKVARETCFERHKLLDDGGRIYMRCSCGCDTRFNPAITKWRADHAARHAEGGLETADNLWPIIESHDAGPGGKAAQDTAAVAHGKRASAKHYGVSQSKGFYRPAGMSYNWATGRYERDM